ncbi:tRNA pseudouridine(38-40) synthase TruA [Rhodohalobacter sp. 614A]|uniref:tRNA pseudouridine(38-40) synthase TruA n=1 Tax=Rhodohalobacter sp. 614A TaxID=2908649 RepID=UPI001F3DB369|nr:tRNA pseudouridine(38-40) synthase TruA [Rhodohalobacter sp. 614A]
MNNRYKLTFEYDGTNFNGWQKQPEGRTVQDVIEKALSTFYQEQIEIVGQGRTDAGVHAKEQVAHADLPSLYSLQRILRAMAGLFPEDVALVDAKKMDDDFHARFHAKSRIYQYRVLERQSPIMRNFSWSVFKPVSVALLDECAGMILGEHDFINFCIPPDISEMTTLCTIQQSFWRKEEGVLIYQIEGNRFLRHLVRRLVGAMVQVADGTLQFNDFQQLLVTQPARRKAHAAPAKGLTLMSVSY